MTDFNEFLQPLDAPVTTHEQVNGFEFDTTSDRGMVNSFQVRNASIGSAQIGTAAIHTANIADLAVTSAKINSFSFNSGTGGTLTLGGTANGNGLMQVLNAAGGTAVKLDNNGLTVSNGSITIQDSNGTNIIDSTGLISTANFINSQVTDSNAFTTSSSTLVDVTNMSLTISLVRSANVLLGASVVGRNNSADGITPYTGLGYMEISGTTFGGAMVTPGISTAGGVLSTTAASMTIASLSAGTYTLKLRAKVSAAGGVLSYPASNEKTMYYVVLGK